MSLKHHPRPYDFRVHADPNTLRQIKDAYREYNTAVARVEDFLLTLRAGISPTHGKNRNARVRLALSYLNAETQEKPLAQFQGERIVVEDPVHALRTLLENAEVENIDEWLKDCSVALKSPRREDAVWVNRRAMFLRDLQVNEDAVLTTITDKIQPDYLNAKTSDEKAGEEVRDYSKGARNLISRAFGDGPKKDRSTEHRIAQATIAYLDHLEGETPTSDQALPLILKKAGESLKSFEKVCGRGSPSALTLWLRAHLIDPKKKKQPSDQQKGPWDLEAQAQLRKVCAKVKKTYQKHLREDLSWMKPYWSTLFPEFSSQTSATPAMVAAMTTVFSHHTKISNQEIQRLELIERAQELQGKLDKHPKGVEFLTKHLEERQAEHPTYQLRPAASTGWREIKAEFEKEKDPAIRQKIAQTLPHQQRKSGDVRLFEALATEEGKAAWVCLPDFVNWMEASEKSAHRRVPTFWHRTHEKGCSPLSFSANDWRCRIHEDSKGKHQAELFLFNDDQRRLTVDIRNRRADVELALGVDAEPKGQGRFGTLGTVPEGARPYLGGESQDKELSDMSWMLSYKHDIPYLKFTPRIGAKKEVTSLEEAVHFVGIDMGLRASISYAQGRVIPAPEVLFKKHADTLRPIHFKNQKGEDILSAMVGTVDGKKTFFRRIGWNDTRWIEFQKFGTINAQGSDKDRKTSSWEYQFTVNLVKRTGRRTPVKARLSRAQRMAVDSAKLLVRAHKDVAKTIHYLRNDPERGIRGWQLLARNAHEFVIRKTATHHWRRSFGTSPKEDKLPTGVLPRRLEEVADALEKLWEEHETSVGDLVQQVEDWIAPSRGNHRARSAGGLSDHRLETINRLRSLLSAWEGRPTPEDPAGQRFRDYRPPRLQRLDEYLQRKKEEQKKQAVAELFRRVGDACDVLVIEDLHMGGDQRQKRRSNRQGARLAPTQVKQILQDQANLRGVRLLEADAWGTSQHDLRTGDPALRCGEISVEQFVTRFPFASRYWSNNPSPEVRAAQKDYLERLYAQWNPKTQTWTDNQGRLWKLASQVPRLRWKGPGEHPPHVCIPQTHGSLLLSLDNGELRFANCDQHAAGNVLLARTARTWRPFYDAWKKTTNEKRLEILKALERRELPAHARSKVANRRRRVKAA